MYLFSGEIKKASKIGSISQIGGAPHVQKRVTSRSFVRAVALLTSLDLRHKAVARLAPSPCLLLLPSKRDTGWTEVTGWKEVTDQELHPNADKKR